MTDKTKRNRYYIKGVEGGFYRVSDAKKYAIEHKHDFINTHEKKRIDGKIYYKEVCIMMGKQLYGVYIFGGDHLYKVYSYHSVGDSNHYKKYLYDESEA